METESIFLWGLGLLSTLLMFKLTNQNEKIKSIESQLSEKKYHLYSNVIYIFFDIVSGIKTNKPVSEKVLLSKMLDIKRDMYVYAPDEIFKKFTLWLINLDNHNNSTLHFKDYFELITLIRKDMGHKHTKLTMDDFMLFLMQNRTEYQKFKEVSGWE